MLSSHIAAEDAKREQVTLTAFPISPSLPSCPLTPYRNTRKNEENHEVSQRQELILKGLYSLHRIHLVSLDFT